MIFQDRFWGNVNKGGPILNLVLGRCWEWTGGCYKRGYGQSSPFGTDRYAHRIAYRLSVGEIPEGKLLRHLCNNPPCVNPKHLAIGTMVENYQDAVDSGTAPFAERNGNSKYSSTVIQEVKHLAAKGLRRKAISQQTGVKYATVKAVVQGKRRRRG